MVSKLQKARENIRRWRENPVSFVHDQFGIEPDAWQRKVLEAFPSQDPDKLRISMQACVGPGKSAVLAWCGWNFLSCYGERGEHPKGAAVSVTRDNLKDNLWPEFSKWQQRSEFLTQAFTWTKERIFANDHPETWFLSARSWSKNANADEQGRTLSGLHSKYVLALLDESGEIPLPVLKAAEQTLSNCKFGKILQAGNPTSLEGILYAAATNSAGLWYIVRITGDPDDPERSPRIDIDWARRQIQDYGRDNPWVMSSILGLFPPSSINALLGPDEVQASMGKHLREDQYSHAQKRLGVDVARFGTDRTVIFPRQGLAAFNPAIMRNATTDQIAARVAQSKVKWGSELEFVDGSGGFGGGVVDQLRLAGHSPLEINFASKASDPRFYNHRAYILFKLAEWVKGGGALPDRPGMKKELCAITYTMKDGKLLIESKDQIKERLGFSTDETDALALTFSYPDMPAQGWDPLSKITRGNQVAKEADPFRDEVFN